MDGKINGSMIV